VPGGTAGQLDEDKVDEMTATALAPFLRRLHYPRSVTAGHAERHPLGLAVAQAGALAAAAQIGTHRRRLTLGAHVEALGHVGRPQLPGIWPRADPARRTHVRQRVHGAVATHTRSNIYCNRRHQRSPTVFNQ